MKKYSVIDLFAGAGGLSLGFEQTQKFDIKVAFEKNPIMQATYRKNHPNVEVLGDVCNADYSNIVKKHGTIDIVIGGPPCQGFSNANRQKNHAINANNMLIKQYLRAIKELQPKAFIMENVSMLRSDVHRFFLEYKDQKDIDNLGIPVQTTSLPLLDTQYMFDEATTIVKDASLIKQYLLSDEEYNIINVIYKSSRSVFKLQKALKKHKKQLLQFATINLQNSVSNHIENEMRNTCNAFNSYYSGLVTEEELIEKIAPTIMIQRMLSKGLELLQNHIVVDAYSIENGLSATIRSFAVFDYIKGVLAAPENDYIIKSDVLCAADFGVPQKRMRFVIMGIKRNILQEISLPRPLFTKNQYRTVRDAIEDLETIKPVYDLKNDFYGIPIEPFDHISELADLLRDSTVLKNHIITRTTDIAMRRFMSIKQGQNFHSLEDNLKKNTYTDISRTQNTIYLRLNYNEPSGTVVNVRKSMWIHPVLNRAISVREAARLQSFPDSFIFEGTKDSQYQQVGNAVPPLLAKAIANHLFKLLQKSNH